MIYFDNSATTPPRQEILDFVLARAGENFGNPSSIHRIGVEAHRALSRARESVAGYLGVRAPEVLFTSGGTEANNTAVFGATGHRQRGHLITTTFEHPSVLEAFRVLEDRGFEVSWIKPDGRGQVDAGAVRGALRKDTLLVSVIHVNNELGTIQPIAAIGRALSDHPRTLFHVDGVQSYGKILMDGIPERVDLFSFSAHKIHGFKGVGGLYIKGGLSLAPLHFGGDQEGGLRPGTENVPGILSLGEATRLAQAHQRENFDRVTRIKAVLRQGLEGLAGIRFNGGGEVSPYIQSLSCQGMLSEVVVHALEEEGLYVSSGSACHARHKVSHVLKAIDLPEEYLQGTLRISFSAMNTLEEAGEAVKIIRRTHGRLKNYF